MTHIDTLVAELVSLCADFAQSIEQLVGYQDNREPNAWGDLVYTYTAPANRDLFTNPDLRTYALYSCDGLEEFEVTFNNVRVFHYYNYDLGTDVSYTYLPGTWEQELRALHDTVSAMAHLDEPEYLKRLRI